MRGVNVARLCGMVYNSLLDLWETQLRCLEYMSDPGKIHGREAKEKIQVNLPWKGIKEKCDNVRPGGKQHPILFCAGGFLLGNLDCEPPSNF